MAEHYLQAHGRVLVYNSWHGLIWDALVFFLLSVAATFLYIKAILPA